ncbi:hypothetical protein FI667_g2374, partial [Globisporangium splendens]
MLDHAPRTLDQRPIHAFGHSVELGSVWRSELLHDASVATERGEPVRRVLSAVVAPKHLHTLPGLGLSKLDELHELVQRFRLAAKQEHHTESRLVVDERHEVALVGERHCLHRAAHIAVHDVEHVLGALGRSRLEIRSRLLAERTSAAQLPLAHRRDVDADSELVLHNRVESAMADVVKSQMLQVRLSHPQRFVHTCDARTLRLHRRHAQLEQTLACALADLPLLSPEVRIADAGVECHRRHVLRESADREQVACQLGDMPHVREHTLL